MICLSCPHPHPTESPQATAAASVQWWLSMPLKGRAFSGRLLGSSRRPRSQPQRFKIIPNARTLCCCPPAFPHPAPPTSASADYTCRTLQGRVRENAAHRRQAQAGTAATRRQTRGPVEAVSSADSAGRTQGAATSSSDLGARGPACCDGRRARRRRRQRLRHASETPAARQLLMRS